VSSWSPTWLSRIMTFVLLPNPSTSPPGTFSQCTRATYTSLSVCVICSSRWFLLLTCQNPLSRTSCITSHYATYSSPFEAIINPRVPVHFAYFYFCVNTNTPQSVRNSHTCTSLTIHYIIHSTHPPRRHHQPLFLQFNNLVIFAILYRHSIAVH